MDEENLPSLHIRRKKKQPRTNKHNPLPQLHLKQRQAVPRSNTTRFSPASQNNTQGYQGQDRHQPEGGKWRLGRDIQKGRYLDAPQFSRRQGLYITGIQGTGKSVLIENLIIQDIKQNMGVCLLDPHGDLTQAVLSRIPNSRVKDVIYLDINNYRYPFGINLFQCPDLTDLAEVQKTIDQVIHVFEKLLGVSHETPLILEYLQNCTHTLIANPGYTMADIPLLLQDSECRKKLVAQVTDSDVQLFWRLHEQKKPADQSYDMSSTLRRVREFLKPLSRPIVGQSTSTIDIRKVMDEGKILLVRLDARLESVTSLIGSLFIAQFLNAAYARPVNKRRQFNLYADEFQRFATEDFATLLEEARKFGIGITIAHQNGSQLETTLKERARSVANLVVFKVNSIDADELAGEFDITPQEAWEEVLEDEWEEELEEEWVEVIKPQRHERVEEQIEVEVEQDIEEITQDPIDYLINRTHSRKEVREASIAFLPFLNKKGKQAVNVFLVDVMEKRIPPHTEEFVKRVYDCLRNIGFNRDDLDYPNEIYANANEVLYRAGQFDYEKQLSKAFDHFKSQLLACIQAVVDSGWESNRKELVDARVDLAYAYDNYNSNSGPGFNIIQGKRYYYDKKIPTQSDRERYRKEHTSWYAGQTDGLIFVIKALVALGLGLATDPIRVPTGQKRMVKRIQPHITYLTHEAEKINHPRIAITHPRKTISHPQRTYADMHNEVASQLANLPVFTARVKIAKDNGSQEHTIRTLVPKQDTDRPLSKQALEDRIELIKKQNIQDGYVRERATVEAEIRTRQGQCSQPPEEEPPISRKPR